MTTGITVPMQSGKTEMSIPPKISVIRFAVFLVFILHLDTATAQTVHEESEEVRVVANASYGAGSLHRFLMGNGYRDLWTTPISVPVLNLSTYAGGLTPHRAHTGSQTTSLRLLGADGREYQFRSVDKDPRMVLPEELRITIVGSVIKDGVSSTHPFGGTMAAELLQIAGILHVSPVVMVMPDDPALGQFREQFAGMLGSIEVRADENQDLEHAFADALKVTGSDKLYKRINKSPAHRINRKQFLKARLVDLFIGDRDRHRDNWRWAKMKESDPVIWEPISRDHDHAFENISGFIPLIASNYSAGILAYGPEYPSMYRLTWNGQEVDRRFFAGLSKATWDSVATELQADFTDEALVRVARLLPEEYYALDGERLLSSMRGRRDYLPQAANEFYRYLAREVEIHATDADEEAIVFLIDERTVDITIRERVPGAEPWFYRRFYSFETDEIRLRMFGGDDRVVIRGNGDPNISIRIAAGEGKDVLIDSTAGKTGKIHFYDQPGGAPYTGGHQRKVNRKSYDEWVGSDLDRYPPREWGALTQVVAALSFDTDFGLTLNGGFTRDRFGFRKAPFANRTMVNVGVSSNPARLRLAFSTQFQAENSDRLIKLDILLSGMEMLHYYGFGNDTSRRNRPSKFFDVRQKRYEAGFSYVVPLKKYLRVTVGPTLSYSDTEKHVDRLITELDTTLYGAGDFGEVGAQLSLVLDTRDRPGAPASGYHIQTNIRVFPAVWDVESSFMHADAMVSTYYSPQMQFEPTLAVRVGAQKVWGTFPFQESAFLGGFSNLRGWQRERFAGDAALYGNLDLRLFLSRFFLSVPGRLGVFGLVDAGRVYVDGASPGGWHTGVGGGVWFSLLNPENLISIGIAVNEERTAFFVRGGFDF